MRGEGNPLMDLNNLPSAYEDCSQQAVLVLDEPSYSSSSSSGFRGNVGRKKEGREKGNGGNGRRRKVYECRFCSLKFSKSQALGGHMNRHKPERETEILNKARQLVYSKDNLGCQPMYEPLIRSTMYEPRIVGSSSTSVPPPPPPPPHHQGYPYGSPTASLRSYQQPASQRMNHDDGIGHVVVRNNNNNTATNNIHPSQYFSGYSYIGAPLGHVYGPPSGGLSRGG